MDKHINNYCVLYNKCSKTYFQSEAIIKDMKGWGGQFKRMFYFSRILMDHYKTSSTITNWWIFHCLTQDNFKYIILYIIFSSSYESCYIHFLDKKIEAHRE